MPAAIVKMKMRTGTSVTSRQIFCLRFRMPNWRDKYIAKVQRPILPELTP